MRKYSLSEQAAKATAESVQWYQTTGDSTKDEWHHDRPRDLVHWGVRVNSATPNPIAAAATSTLSWGAADWDTGSPPNLNWWFFNPKQNPDRLSIWTQGRYLVWFRCTFTWTSGVSNYAKVVLLKNGAAIGDWHASATANNSATIDIAFEDAANYGDYYQVQATNGGNNPASLNVPLFGVRILTLFTGATWAGSSSSSSSSSLSSSSSSLSSSSSSSSSNSNFSSSSSSKSSSSSSSSFSSSSSMSSSSSSSSSSTISCTCATTFVITGSSNPSNPALGQMYYNTTDHYLYIYDPYLASWEKYQGTDSPPPPPPLTQGGPTASTNNYVVVANLTNFDDVFAIKNLDANNDITYQIMATDIYGTSGTSTGTLLHNTSFSNDYGFTSVVNDGGSPTIKSPYVSFKFQVKSAVNNTPANYQWGYTT